MKQAWGARKKVLENFFTLDIMRNFFCTPSYPQKILRANLRLIPHYAVTVIVIFQQLLFMDAVQELSAVFFLDECIKLHCKLSAVMPAHSICNK
jgi:hypothetical protein